MSHASSVPFRLQSSIAPPRSGRPRRPRGRRRTARRSRPRRTS
jgi:hypothetical protein